MTAEEKRERKNQNQRNYYHRNKESINPKQLQYQKDHPDIHNAINRKYYQSQQGRAVNLVNSYKRKDKENDRGECTLTKDWIIDNIFTSSCVYCGESDWKLLGCDRIDNSLPHTPENVVCSCKSCNNNRQWKRMSVEEFKEHKKKEQS